MKLRSALGGVLLLAWLAAPAVAQKIKVGFDKGVDFSKYASYSIAQPDPAPSRPMLYLCIVGSIQRELDAKGLRQQPEGGDLVVVPAGGLEFGINAAAGTPFIPILSGPLPSVNSTMWSGTGGIPNAAAPYIPQGTLLLSFVDRGSNKVVWSGTVQDKFDIEKKDKAIRQIDRGITKLLRQFPPPKK